MPKLTSTIFRTPNGNLAKFLSDNFDLAKTGNQLLQKREPSVGTAIELEEKDEYVKLKTNRAFWKVGFLMPDVQKHATALGLKGLKVSQPAQFLEIGYFCNISDTDGNDIELLQTVFEANFKGPYAENPITLGQITIRTSKLDESLDFYQKRLGMKLLSIQPVEQYGFCLYFLGYTDDTPPNTADLKAVENREWLWGKPYCTIEIQHVKGASKPYEDLKGDEKGWMGMRITATEQEAKDIIPGMTQNTLIRDPNNIPIYVDIEK